ncbi:MAG: hypothetical protein A2X52_20830 [Candidatus Rokubacteria bacterium GWC2_70_16]|nr:MAG: hypothetical protein A2X52_20830 [Candidatus Rokubacteria bacterium GWC2_70_16]
MISADLTVASLLDDHPQLLDVLAEYHPHFKQLRNTLLRKVMAPRVTVAQAARIAGVPVEEMLGMLRRAAGEAAAPAPHAAASPSQGADGGESPRPPALAAVPEAQQVHLDVREDIARGQEPFARIMAAVKGLRDGEAFVLRAPFEPIPLYDVLGKRGLARWTESLGPGDFRVWFYREPAASRSEAPGAAGAAADRSHVVRLDVRGLEPPQPMVRVLEQLDGLAAGQDLEVIHDRRPLFLYPQLEERGFAHETDEPEAGVVRILIRRRGVAG